jgi:hypothetical protein
MVIAVRKYTVGLLALLMCVLAIVVFFMGRQSADVTSLVQEKLQKDNSQDLILNKTQPLVTKSSRVVSMPPPYTPLKDMLPALKIAADKGDADAACRIGIELARCRLTQGAAKRFNAKLSEMEKAANKSPEMANHLAELQLKYLRYENEVCAGIEPKELSLANHYLHQAAVAGNTDAGIAYADGQAFGSDESLTFLQDTGLGQWQQDAQRIAENSVIAGTPEAVFLLQDAYTNDTSFFSALIVNDPSKALIYDYLLSMLSGRTITANPDFSSQVNSDAMQQAREAHKKYFNEKTFSYPELIRRTKLLSIESDTDKPVCQ